MKRKNVLVILIIFSTFLISSGLIYLFVFTEDSEVFSVNTDLSLELCVDSSFCRSENLIEYPIFDIDYSGKEIVNFFEKINSDVMGSYEKNKNSFLEEDSCTFIASEFNYRYEYNFDYQFFEDEDYLIFSYIKTEKDLCTDNIEYFIPEIFIYSLEEDKLLNEEFLINKYSISEENINGVLEQSILAFNSLNNTNYSIEDYNYLLYIDSLGNPSLYYSLIEETKYESLLLNPFAN